MCAYIICVCKRKGEEENEGRERERGRVGDACFAVVDISVLSVFLSSFILSFFFYIVQYILILSSLYLVPSFFKPHMFFSSSFYTVREIEIRDECKKETSVFWLTVNVVSYLAIISQVDPTQEDPPLSLSRSLRLSFFMFIYLSIYLYIYLYSSSSLHLLFVCRVFPCYVRVSFRRVTSFSFVSLSGEKKGGLAPISPR